PNRVPPHQDIELTDEREKCFRRVFPDADERRTVNTEFANFSNGREGFENLDTIVDRDKMDPKTWWLVHVLELHYFKRNKMTPYRAEALVYVHSNLRLLSRSTPQYHHEETKMWDVAGDEFGSLDDSGFLEVVDLSLDESGLEAGFLDVE
ncbi:hypothetical protein A2U01_0022831, partial [Trifolium medium]|nr:hypothetical protein [Trifolium medium]